MNTDDLENKIATFRIVTLNGTVQKYLYSAHNKKNIIFTIIFIMSGYLKNVANIAKFLFV